MYEVFKHLGLCTLCLLANFLAFTANFLARSEPAH